MTKTRTIVYCSWSEYKVAEWNISRNFYLSSGVVLGDVIDLEFRRVATREPLLRNLSEMVHAKAISAYQAVRVPCVVEHTGLILHGYETEHYPGGLTQPMWNALGAAKFVATCSALGESAIARAVIGYCDGASVRTFVGETKGTLRPTPAGAREFYWDTVFCPEGCGGRSYAEIADTDLKEKLKISNL